MLSPRRFLAENRSVAALEFALILPIMLVLLAGVYDITEALIVKNTINEIANGVVSTASIIALQDHTDNSTALSYDQVQLAESTIWADFPDLRRGQKNGNKSVTLSSIDFEPPGGCPGANCNPYTAYVIWSESYQGGTSGQTFQNNLRACVGPTIGGETQVSQSTALTLSDFTYTLPTLEVATSADYTSGGDQNGDETGPPPVLVADVTFTYTPLFNFYIKSNITFLATALWPVRSVKNVQAAGNYLPLSQQFTTILGIAKNGTLTLYNPDGTIDADAPTVTTGGGTSSSFCINPNEGSPPGYPYSAPTTASTTSP